MPFRPMIFMLFLWFTGLSPQLSAQVVSGRITNEQQEPVAYATIYIQELKEGTISNAEGHFQLQLPQGSYRFTIRSLGYRPQERKVTVYSDSLRLNLVMQRQEFKIKEVTVVPGKEDPAYYIVRRAMARAAYYREKIKHYEARLYIKSNFTFTNIPRLYENQMEIDGKKLKDVLKEDQIYVIESHNKITFDYPQHYSQEVISKRSSLMGFDEPPVMGLITSSFYQDRPNQVISPLAPMALNHYTYRYEGYITSDKADIFKIKVVPKRKSDELVEGYMYIVDQLWCLYHVNFNTRIKFFNFEIKQQYENLGNDNWLPVSHFIEGDFSLLGLKGEFYYGASLDYQTIEENVFSQKQTSSADSVTQERYQPGKKEAELRKQVAAITAKKELTNRDVRKAGRLNRKIRREQYRDTTLTFNRQRDYNLQDKVDSVITSQTYWDTVRTIPLSPAELRSYEMTDSLRKQQGKADSSVPGKPVKKKPVFLKVISGHPDFFPGSHIQLGYDGLIASKNFDFNTVDGYKYKQSFRFRSVPDSGKSITMLPEIGYAFNRKALFWQVNNRFDNLLASHNRLEVHVGKMSRDFKPEALGIHPGLNSISAWFFAKNYMKLYEASFAELSLSQRVTKNLNVKAMVEYNQFSPLKNHTNYKLSDRKEYEPNVPAGFQENHPALLQQKSFAFSLTAGFLKYQSKPWLENSGFLFLSDYYHIRLSYKQGVKNVFSSISDFSQVDVQFHQQAHLSPGTGIDWHFTAGSFIHARQLHFSQYKHFSTAESPVSFSPFTHTFQLLNDYQPATAQNYVNIGAELRSEYLLMRYVSFINQRTWSESLHVNYLHTHARPHYWETGYSINHLFLMGNAGVFAGFNGTAYQNIIFKVSVSFL